MVVVPELREVTVVGVAPDTGKTVFDASADFDVVEVGKARDMPLVPDVVDTDGTMAVVALEEIADESAPERKQESEILITKVSSFFQTLYVNSIENIHVFNSTLIL